MFAIPPKAPEHMSRKTRKLVEMISHKTAELVNEARAQEHSELKALLERTNQHVRQLIHEGRDSNLQLPGATERTASMESFLGNPFSHLSMEKRECSHVQPAELLLEKAHGNDFYEIIPVHSSSACPLILPKGRPGGVQYPNCIGGDSVNQVTSFNADLPLDSGVTDSNGADESSRKSESKFHFRSFKKALSTDSISSQMSLPKINPLGRLTSGESAASAASAGSLLESISEDVTYDGKDSGESETNLHEHTRKDGSHSETSVHDHQSVHSSDSEKQKRHQSALRRTLQYPGTSPAPMAKHSWWRDFDDPDSSVLAHVYSATMNPLISVNVFLSVAARFGFEAFDGDWLGIVLMFFDVLFAIEVLLRFCFAFNKINFLKDPFNIIDIIAVIPQLIVRAEEGFEVSTTMLTDGPNLSKNVVRALGPVFKVCKILRRFPTFHLLIFAFTEAMEALPVLMFVFGLIGLTFASLIYVVEPKAGPIVTFQDACWVTIITMTTTGYGDKVPQSEAGKVLVSMLLLTQMLYTSLPIGILGQQFTKTWTLRHRFMAVKLVRSRLSTLGLGLKDVPNFFDTFGDDEGALDFNGFTSMIHALGVNLNERRMREVYKGFDEDGGGSIDEMEFVMAVFPKEYEIVLEEEKRLRDEIQSNLSSSEVGASKWGKLLVSKAKLWISTSQTDADIQ